jgi:hypothetical protein
MKYTAGVYDAERRLRTAQAELVENRLLPEKVEHVGEPEALLTPDQ